MASTTPPPLAWLTRDRVMGANILIGTSAVLILFGLYLVYKQSFLEVIPVAARVWLVMWGLLLAAIGWYQRLRPPVDSDKEDEIRLNVGVATLATTGLLIAVCSLGLLYEWYTPLSDWLNGRDNAEPLKPMLALLFHVLGLQIIYFGLTPLRVNERRSVTARVVLNGFLSLVTSYLFLLILVVLNLVSSQYVTATVSAGQGSYTSLSNTSREILRNLKENLSITVVMFEEGDPSSGTMYSNLAFDIRQLVQDIREQNKEKIRINFMSPREDKELRELSKKYPKVASKLNEASGCILLVYESKPERSEVFGLRDVFESARFGNLPPTFTGEDKLLTEIASFDEGGSGGTVYFTQGSGELDFGENSEPGAGSREPRRQMSAIKDLLAKRRITAKSLVFDPLNPKVPDDATIVVIAGPKKALPESALKPGGALRDYITARKGKLFVMLDPAPTSRDNPSMLRTGIEDLLTSEFGLEFPPEQVLQNPLQSGSHPANVPVELTSTASSQPNPIVQVLSGREIQIPDLRPVRAAMTPKESYRVTPILASAGQVWLETDLNSDAVEIFRELARSPALQRQKIARSPVSVMATVIESSTPPSMPGMPPPPPGKDKPRVVAIGTSFFISNAAIGQGRNPISADLVLASLDWLRERPTSLGIANQTYRMYTPKGKLASWQFFNLVLILSGVLAVTAGVFTIRRK